MIDNEDDKPVEEEEEKSLSDKITEEDLSESHPLPVDPVGAHKHFRSLHTNDEEYIMEVIQNAIDSKDFDESNVIEIYVNEDAKEDEAFLVIMDHGDGITKDYGGDIIQWRDAMKTTSEKKKRKAVGKHGIGIFDYNNLGIEVIITSMDKEMVYRIPLYIDAKGLTSIGKIRSHPNKPEYQKELGIFHMGTKVAFFKRPKGIRPIDLKLVTKMLRESYTLLLARNPRIAIIVQSKPVELPDWIKQHPERELDIMSDGQQITGAIWRDEKGEGSIMFNIDGHYIETISLDDRQATGYVNLDSLIANQPRTAIMKNNETWTEARNKIFKILSRFPRSGDHTKRISRETKDIFADALKDLIPRNPPKNTGNAHIEETTGDPDALTRGGPTGEEKKPVEHPIGPTGPKIHPGIENSDSTTKIRQRDPKKNKPNRDWIEVKPTDKRSKYEAFVIPYLDRYPILAELNQNNPEWIPYTLAKSKKTKLGILLPSLSEIRLMLKMQKNSPPPDEYTFEWIRAQLSAERVHIMKSTGIYPKVSLRQRGQTSSWK